MTIYADFNLISSSWQNPRWQPLLVKSQASSSATIHKMYLFLLRKSKDFHLLQNRFEILQHIKNSGEEFHPPPPPPVPRWGYEFACTSEGYPRHK